MVGFSSKIKVGFGDATKIKFSVEIVICLFRICNDLLTLTICVMTSRFCWVQLLKNNQKADL